jgi:two-component system OmpR family response regulator
VAPHFDAYLPHFHVTIGMKEQIPVYPLDVYVVTDKGEAELKGGSTSLESKELELLVLVDGRANVGEIAARAKSLSGEEVTALLRLMIQRGLVTMAPLADADSLDFTYFFGASKLAPKLSAHDREKAEKEAEAGTPALLRYGYYVSIARQAAQPRKQAKGSKISILIVEDELQLAKFLGQLLGMEGFDPRVAKNREEIVAELRRLPSPDLVLLDVVLPDADGFDVLTRMKQHPSLKTIPVIMLTGKTNRESVMRGLLGGVDGYITKPFEIDILLKAIKSVLGLV